MLLRHLYDFAQSRKLLNDLAFSPKAVRWILELDAQGNLLGQGPIDTADDERGKEFSCPQTTRPKVAGGVSEFLADGLTAIFGLDPDPEKKLTEKQRLDRDQNNVKKQEDFWKQIEAAAQQINHTGLQALLFFRQRLNISTILRWGKSSGTAKSDAKPAWWLRGARGAENKLGPENFTFRVSDKLLLDDDDIRDWWRKRHAIEVKTARDSYTRGLCLVTGRPDQPIAPTHNPKIQGISNTQSFGAAIVSFDKDSFASYGLDQSLNAPTSDEAATAYCTALNHLLERDESSLRIGQTTLCFWAVATQQAGTISSRLLNKPTPQLIASFMNSPWSGMEREIVRKDKFISVTLAGNSGRVVVRHWMQQTLEQAIENFQKWFADLEILNISKPPSKNSQSAEAKKTEFHPLSIYCLSRNTISDEHAKKMEKNLAPETPSQLYRAALENTAPSLTLIKPILNHLRSKLVRDENYKIIYDHGRFALLKLILNRNRKNNDMEIKPTLTADTNDAAYNSGRLLAVLAETQAKAHDYQLTTGVAERYFGTASSSPSSVLPLLLRLNRHHLNKIAKSDRKGDERFLEEQIEEIASKFKPLEEKLPPAFPRNLNLQAQGRFALGFYQQQAQDAAAREEGFVLKYVKKIDEAKYNELVALRESDQNAFSEQLSQFRSAATAERNEKKKSKDNLKKSKEATQELSQSTNQ